MFRCVLSMKSWITLYYFDAYLCVRTVNEIGDGYDLLNDDSVYVYKRVTRAEAT